MPSKEQRMKRLEARFHSERRILHPRNLKQLCRIAQRCAQRHLVVLNKGTQLANNFCQRQRGCRAFLVRQEQTVLLLQLSNAVRRYDKA